jgi:hypothetical protein
MASLTTQIWTARSSIGIEGGRRIRRGFTNVGLAGAFTAAKPAPYMCPRLTRMCAPSCTCSAINGPSKRLGKQPALT